jgi:hypothetical protein
MASAFTAYVQDGGLPSWKMLMERALPSEDAVFRRLAQLGVASTGRTDVADWLFTFQDPRLRPTEKLDLIASLAFTAETRDQAGAWFLDNYQTLTDGMGGHILSHMTNNLG